METKLTKEQSIACWVLQQLEGISFHVETTEISDKDIAAYIRKLWEELRKLEKIREN